MPIKKIVFKLSRNNQFAGIITVNIQHVQKLNQTWLVAAFRHFFHHFEKVHDKLFEILENCFQFAKIWMDVRPVYACPSAGSHVVVKLQNNYENLVDYVA